MLAAMASALVAFLALRGWTISWDWPGRVLYDIATGTLGRAKAA